VQLDGFAAEAVDGEAVRLGVPAAELVSFSVLYYLADVDSGRIARRSPGARPRSKPRGGARRGSAGG
jgi:hypothetical protein